MDGKAFSFTGFMLQKEPKIFVASIPGSWLLERTTPTWRIKDPEKGFQRVVREERVRKIAISVLNQDRTFPNAIVLATDEDINLNDGLILVNDGIRFLVIDGQHRLWAQKFSHFDANYACLIHCGLKVEEMADLFLEINDNQTRVPSSLRWDLVRLVRPEEDPNGVAAAEIVYSLTTDKDSPLFQRIDLTGEQSEINLKQGSITPDLKRFISRSKILNDISFEQLYDLILQYFIAIKNIDGDLWGSIESTFYKARVIRALIMLLSDLILMNEFQIKNINYQFFIPFLKKINKESLDPENIRSQQGSAGIKAIYDVIKKQVMD